jgi:hypothetical protein
MNPADLAAAEALLTECQRMSLELGQAKALPSSEAIKEEIARRKRQTIRVREEKAKLQRKIAELRGWISTLGIVEDRLDADIAELDDVKWNRIHDERAAGTHHGVTSEHNASHP